MTMSRRASRSTSHRGGTRLVSIARRRVPLGQVCTALTVPFAELISALPRRRWRAPSPSAPHRRADSSTCSRAKREDSVPASLSNCGSSPPDLGLDDDNVISCMNHLRSRLVGIA